MVVLEPEDNIVVGERLWPDPAHVDGFVAECINHILGVLLLGVALERHRDLSGRSLELRGEVAITRVAVNKIDVFV